MGGPAQRRIVVGVSGSLNSVVALQRAGVEARLSGRRLLAVLVWRPRDTDPPHGSGASAPKGARRAAMRLLADTLNDVFGATDDDVQVEGLAMSGTAGRTLVQIARRDDDLPGRGGRASKGAASKALPGRPVLSHPRLVPGARRAAVAPPARPGSDDQPETASEGHGRRPRRGTAPGRSTRARVHRR
ncbi:universal stress protein [Streptomyces sp. NPDC093228]|uniref:universal stress protein n=1 Tax=Streptomyces sp. NPDC093228 TaxID=3155070 RepID=UPI00342DBE28